MLNIKILYISDKMSCKKERTDESMASENITILYKGDRNVEVTEQDVFLKDIVSMELSDKKILPNFETVKILKLHGNREQRYVVSVLEIIACIHAAYPEVEVQNLGEADIIVMKSRKLRHISGISSKWQLWQQLSFLALAFSIMAFNNDVGGTKLFGQIYELVMGKQSDGFTVLEVTYSIRMDIWNPGLF